MIKTPSEYAAEIAAAKSLLVKEYNAFIEAALKDRIVDEIRGAILRDCKCMEVSGDIMALTNEFRHMAATHGVEYLAASGNDRKFALESAVKTFVPCPTYRISARYVGERCELTIAWD